MEVPRIDESFIKKLIEQKIKVDIATKGNCFYQGYIISLSPNSILMIDKYDEEVMLFLDEIRKIARFKDNGKKEGVKKDGEISDR